MVEADRRWIEAIAEVARVIRRGLEPPGRIENAKRTGGLVQHVHPILPIDREPGESPAGCGDVQGRRDIHEQAQAALPCAVSVDAAVASVEEPHLAATRREAGKLPARPPVKVDQGEGAKVEHKQTLAVSDEQTPARDGDVTGWWRSRTPQPAASPPTVGSADEARQLRVEASDGAADQEVERSLRVEREAAREPEASKAAVGELGASGPSGSAARRMPEVAPTVTPSRRPVRQPMRPSNSQDVGIRESMASPLRGWGRDDFLVG